MEALRIGVIIGAAARLTRLTTRDAITARLRTRVHELVLFDRAQRAARAAGQPVPPPKNPAAAEFRTKVHEGLRCDWCVGVWWSGAITAAHWVVGSSTRLRRAAAVVDILSTTLAAAYALGWLVEHESPPEPVATREAP